MVDNNTGLTIIDPIEVMAKLEPEQQMKLFKIQEKIFIEDRKNQRAVDVENMRLQNALILADKEHQNKLTQLQYQANNEVELTAMKSQAAVALTNNERENKIALADFNSKLAVTTTLMEENCNMRASMIARIENSHKVRDDIYKKQIEAVIQEKLAQKQHKRDLEKMYHESNLKKSEQYFQSICLRLSKLLDNSQDEKVKEEIDQLFAMWEKETNQDE